MGNPLEYLVLKAEEKARMEAEKQVPHIEIFEKPSVYSAPAAADSALVREPSSGGIESPSAANTADQEPDDPAGFLFDDRRMKPQQMTLFAEQKLPPEPVSKAAAAENALQEMLTQVHVPDAAADALTAAADRENVEFQFQEPAKTPRAAPSGEVPASDEQRKKTGEYDPEEHILSKENVKQYHIIGQVFETYWLVEFQDKLLMIDQHAAHEKVNFERLMARLSKELDEADAAGHAPSQLLAPPTIVHLTGKEEAAYLQYADIFQKMGYEIEEFGPGSYALRAVPMELYANEPDALLKEIIDEILAERMSGTPAAILYKIASMSCKAAIKGNMRMTRQEAQALIDELLLLDNPYHCPHGRPTMIVMSQQEMERKFKRIV